MRARTHTHTLSLSLSLQINDMLKPKYKAPCVSTAWNVHSSGSIAMVWCTCQLHSWNMKLRSQSCALMGYIAWIVYSMSTTEMPHIKIVNCDLPVSEWVLPLWGHPDTAVSPEMQHCAGVIVCEDQCIASWWLVLILSAQKMFITSFRILDIPVCAVVWILTASRSHTTVTEKPFPMNWLILKLRESPSYPLLLQLMTLGCIMLHQRQKAVHQMGPSSVSQEGRIQNFSFSEEGYDHCLLGVWVSDFCWCNAKRRDYQRPSSLMPTSGRWQKSGIISNKFSVTT